MKKQTPHKPLPKSVKWLWGIVFAPFALLLLLLLLTAAGLFGRLPSFEELENPKSNLATEILSSDGKVLGTFFVQNRSYVQYDELFPLDSAQLLRLDGYDVPPIIAALISTEDVRYRGHSGIDLISLVRVGVKTVLMQNTSQGGGSTITQQLAKNLFPRDINENRGKIARTTKLVVSKLKEWITALKLEYNYTKEEIAAICAGTSMRCEVFVHGALCMSVSGRRLLSSYMAGRGGNRGECAQPCRWKYYLSEETRPGQLYEIGENENGSYILNANDMCTAPFIDLICKAGVDSLKIEGRAKTFYYVASVTAAYRKALDAYLADPTNDNFELPPEVYAELTRTSHRHYSPGFYFGREQAKQATDSATYIREWEFVGTVDSWENGIAHCQQRGKWSLGDTLEALCPDGRSIPLTPEWIENEAGERVESTPHAMEKYTMPTPELPPMSLLRRKTV